MTRQTRTKIDDDFLRKFVAKLERIQPADASALARLVGIRKSKAVVYLKRAEDINMVRRGETTPDRRLLWVVGDGTSPGLPGDLPPFMRARSIFHVADHVQG